MLMTALMPAFSRSFASDGAANAVLLEMCSAMGVTYTKTPDSDGKQAGKMNDCPYCRVHFDVPVPPPAPAQLPRFEIAAERPALFYRSPTPLFSWVVANPRGPPAA
ncbi:Protein of unknown function [Duganella sp. CF517]|nr:Protein of unknown function [Duganella sp. CF517]